MIQTVRGISNLKIAVSNQQFCAPKGLHINAVGRAAHPR